MFNNNDWFRELIEINWNKLQLLNAQMRLNTTSRMCNLQNAKPLCAIAESNKTHSFQMVFHKTSVDKFRFRNLHMSAVCTITIPICMQLNFIKRTSWICGLVKLSHEIESLWRSRINCCLRTTNLIRFPLNVNVFQTNDDDKGDQ